MKSIKLFATLLLLLTIATTASAYNFTRDLELGARGGEVTKLQEMLVGAGHLESDSVTGYFGPATELAVAKWQIANDIKPISGIFGAISRAIAHEGVAPAVFGDLSSVVSTTTSAGFTSSQIALINSGFVVARIIPQSIVAKTLSGISSLNNEEAMSLLETLRSKRVLSRNDYNRIKDEMTTDLNPIALLKINGVSDLTVNPGQNYTYSWSSENGKKFSAKWETITGQNAKCGGASGNLNFINSASGSKAGQVAITSSHAGCVWEITFEVIADDGTEAESVAFLRVPAAAAALAPTASLLVNNSHSVTINPGDRYVYSWTSTNGATASGKWSSNDATKCVAANGIMRNMNTLSGSYTATETVTTANAGCIWTVIYEVKNADGVVATSSVAISVPAATTPTAPVAPTARLRIDGETNLTVNPGESYTYAWSSTNGVSATSNWTSNNASKCGAGGSMTGMNTLSGSKSNNAVISEGQAGCVWTINYVVKNSANVAATSTATLRVPDRAAALAPTANLKISNQSSLTVVPGTAYNYSWTSTNGVSAKGTWRTTAGDTAKCGVSGTMAGMNTLIGSLDRVTPITTNHAGCVWEVKYEVENADGVKVNSTAVLSVPTL